MDKSILHLGWCQAYAGLKYHYEDAYLEKYGKAPSSATDNPPYAIFSKKYYNSILALNNDKIHDFCFIGNASTSPSRNWIIKFAIDNFTENSIFVHTGADITNWKPLGPFDYTLTAPKFSPCRQANTQSRESQFRNVSENLYYFQSMRNSKYCLCPEGDAPWSFRFYEVLMCESIPIVTSWHYTYRSPEESKIDYNYYLTKDIFTYDESMIKKNTEIFCKYHLLD